MSHRKKALTDSEWTILATVWELAPCSARRVQDALHPQKGWSYSTVKTFMDRMVIKGLLHAERRRNSISYRPAITRKDAQTTEVLRVVRRAFDGALPPVMQFLLGQSTLSEEELDELEAMIRRRRETDGTRGPEDA